MEEMFAVDNPEIKRVDQQVDFLIDSAMVEADENDVLNTPSQDAEEELDRVHSDIAGYGDEKDEENEYPPGPEDADDNTFDDSGMEIGESLSFILSEEDYKTFFKSMLDAEGISGIKDLSGEKKKAFFNKVDAAWKAKKETD